MKGVEQITIKAETVKPIKILQLEGKAITEKFFLTGTKTVRGETQILGDFGKRIGLPKKPFEKIIPFEEELVLIGEKAVSKEPFVLETIEIPTFFEKTKPVGTLKTIEAEKLLYFGETRKVRPAAQETVGQLELELSGLAEMGKPQTQTILGKKSMTIGETYPNFLSQTTGKKGAKYIVSRETVSPLMGKEFEAFSRTTTRETELGTIGESRFLVETKTKDIPTILELKTSFEIPRKDLSFKIEIPKGKMPSKGQISDLVKLGEEVEQEKAFWASPKGMIQIQKERSKMKVLGLPEEQQVSKAGSGLTIQLQKQAEEIFGVAGQQAKRPVSISSSQLTGTEFDIFSPQKRKQKLLEEQIELQQLIEEGEFFAQQTPMIGADLKPGAFVSTINYETSFRPLQEGKRTGIREGQRIGVIGIQQLKGLTKEESRIKQGEAFRLGTVLGIKPVSTAITGIKLVPMVGVRLGAKQTVMQRQKQLQRQLLRTTTITIPREVPLLKEEVIERPPPPVIWPRRKQRPWPIRFDLRRAFEVITGRGKKQQTIARGVPLGIALAIGQKEVKETARASFRLEPFGTTTRKDIVPRLDILQFRKAKRGHGFVERRQFRIDMPGEKKEIPYKAQQLRRLGLLKTKNRKNETFKYL